MLATASISPLTRTLWDIGKCVFSLVREIGRDLREKRVDDGENSYSKAIETSARENENKSRSNRHLVTTRPFLSSFSVRFYPGPTRRRDPFANVDEVVDAKYPKMKLSLRSRGYLLPVFKPREKAPLISHLSLAFRIYFPIFSRSFVEMVLRYNGCIVVNRRQIRFQIIRLPRNNSM